MKAKNGHFVISLDFELFWGVFDAKNLDSYSDNLKNVRLVIPKLLELCDRYNVSLNFASVGLLFAKNKEDIANFKPTLLPTYDNQNFNPYKNLDRIGDNEEDDPYHYANSLLSQISHHKKHEIGSHTFSHFYCNEKGQTNAQFEEDLKANISIAKRFNVNLRSFVFPRNQINKECLNICHNQGFISYRGIEKNWIYNTHDTRTLESPICKAMRLLDCYINLTGHHTYDVIKINANNRMINIPSSKFLRPYFKPLSIIEPIKVWRIKSSMTHAAKQNEVFHLWWHPHNFGRDMEKNFNALELILKHYEKLNQKHNFESITMGKLAEQTLSVLAS